MIFLLAAIAVSLVVVAFAMASAAKDADVRSREFHPSHLKDIGDEAEFWGQADDMPDHEFWSQIDDGGNPIV